jgi:hypothetical protein
VKYALALMVLLCGCQPKSAEAVADKFVDLYFVEIDQQKALALTTGLAHTKLEEELGLVEKVRHQVDPDQAKPSVYYTRQSSHVEGDRAQLTYDISIKQGRDETKRSALISAERVEGAWKVGNFMVREGHAPVAAPPAH